MKYLIDTHTLLWTIFDPGKLSKSVKQEMGDPENEVAVSIISFWEISLKYGLGKLELINIEPDALPGIAEETGIEILSITPGEVASFYKLPKLAHRDPFDRLIIWQAIQRKMKLISRDQEFKEYQRYGLNLYW
ncbi:MAG: type II toxin-antitoxin system VapC family toxin [Desulfobacteraceae bacterium]|nr:MAG: type II toxin-antitoxin system VapC family toxin [Desulfobacteraceae bacterium]